MRHCLSALALAFVLPTALVAQGASPARTAARSAARSAARGAAAFFPARLERIDSWVNGLIAQKQLPGAVVMIVKDGQVAVHKAYGARELGAPAPMRRDDIFRMASQTKAITSLAVMMLWEEGKFQLDDPISKYIPAFKNQTILVKFNSADSSYESKPTKRRTTIRQLLTHTGGLDYAGIGSDEFKAIYAKAGITAMGRAGDVLADRVDALGRMPLKQEPGDRFTYSLSIDVLGRLVEVLSGVPLDQFFRTRIFEPLRMPDTWFELPAAKRNRLVALHVLNDDSVTVAARHAPDAKQPESIHPDWPTQRWTYFAGGGGLSGTTADYARFLQLFLNMGELDGVRLLGRKTVEMMLTNQIGTLQPPFGLGFQLETADADFRSPASLGTFSWGGAFKTTYWADPREQLIALIYTNVLSPLDITGPFRALVYSSLR